MGSLPNLHELEKAERKREKRREYEFLLEQRARDASERERLPLHERNRKQTSYNAYLKAGIDVAGGTINLTAAATATATAMTANTTAIAIRADGAGVGAGIIHGLDTGTGVAGAAGASGGGGDGGAGAGLLTALSTTTASAGPRPTQTRLSGRFSISGTAILGLTGQSFTRHLANARHHHFQQPFGHSHSHPHQHQHHHQHQHQYQHPHSHPHQHQHQYQRHSLTTRQRVLRARSSGATHSIFDDQPMEHMSAHSPASARSHRINPVSSIQVQAALVASRRRESINSSIGATSIHRLITLNNRNCRNRIPAHVRHKVCKKFSCLVVAHGLMCGVLLPLFALQGSNSIWHHRENWIPIGPNIGSLLLSLCCLISAGMCLIAKRLICKFGYTMLLAGNYAATCIFLLCHLYPSIYTLLPAYLMLGLTLSPGCVSNTSLIVHFANKLSCAQNDATPSSGHGVMESTMHDEHKIFCNHDQKVRRLVRWYLAAQDVGIIMGALVASMIMKCSVNDWNCPQANGNESSALDHHGVASNQTPKPPIAPILPGWPHASGYLDNFYSHNDQGARICGADMCPIWRHQMTPRELRLAATITPTSIPTSTPIPTLLTTPTPNSITTPNPTPTPTQIPTSTPTLKQIFIPIAADTTATTATITTTTASSGPSRATATMMASLQNGTANKTFPTTAMPMMTAFTSTVISAASRITTASAPPPVPSVYSYFINSRTRIGGTTLIAIYMTFSTIALILSMYTGRVQAPVRKEGKKDMSDTLMLAGPMAYFIGTEQAYMLADFMRAFVSCTLGISMVGGALVGTGFMQAIVSCTLSMLLRHTKRIVVISGFFFHSCLLLALSCWKPSTDDSALFYVIAASWGACNGMWETLLLTLVTLNHSNNVADVTALLQTLRFLGLAVTFGAHGYLCETAKIIALVIILVVSVPPYAMLEIRLEAQRKAALLNL